MRLMYRNYHTHGLPDERVRALAYRLYDTVNIFHCIVDATAPSVLVPEYFKNQTSFYITISPDHVTRIDFSSDGIELVSSFSDGSNNFTAFLPYSAIKSIRAPLWEHKVFKNLPVRYKEPIGIGLTAILILCAVVATTEGWSFYGYKLFSGVSAAWSSDNSVFLHKLFAIMHGLFEVMFSLAIAPLAVLYHVFGLGGLYGEVLVVFIIIVSGILASAIEKANKKPGVPTLTELNLEMLGLRPIFSRRKFDVKNDFCFYVGPFIEKATSIYEHHIKRALTDRGLRIQRSDEIFSARPVIDEIWECINESGIVIAEVTGRNPNVMYEIGMAHTIGKKVVILTQSINDVPFDLQRHRFILYEDTEEGRKDLEFKIVSTIEHELGLRASRRPAIR